MGNQNYRIYLGKLESSKKRILKLCPDITNNSGIYIFYRYDENGFKYAYVGQAKHLLDRVSQHLFGYQHIDLSIKKHGLFDEEKNFYGYYLDFYYCDETELDAEEQESIKLYADRGFQLRNETTGSQGKGKAAIDIGKSTKGYREGVDYGYSKAIKDVKEYFDKYLDYQTKSDPECFKKPNKHGEVLLKEIYIKKYDEFKELLENETIH